MGGLFIPGKERDGGFYFGYVKFEMFVNYPSGGGEPAVIYSGLKSTRMVRSGQEYKFEVTTHGTRKTV